MSERDLDRLLGGRPPEDGEELEELASFFREAKASHLEAPAEPTEARHLAAIVGAAQLLTADDRPARPARRKRVFSPLSPLWAKLAAATAAAALLTGGLAIAGVLPDPLQGPVASAADQVGISLEDPDEPDGDNNNVDDGNTNDRDDGAGEPADERSTKRSHSAQREATDPSDQPDDSQSGAQGQSGETGDQPDQGQAGAQGQSGESGDHPDQGQAGAQNQSGETGQQPDQGPAAQDQSGDSGDSGGSNGQSGGGQQ